MSDVIQLVYITKEEAKALAGRLREVELARAFAQVAHLPLGRLLETSGDNLIIPRYTRSHEEHRR